MHTCNCRWCPRVIVAGQTGAGAALVVFACAGVESPWPIAIYGLIRIALFLICLWFADIARDQGRELWLMLFQGMALFFLVGTFGRGTSAREAWAILEIACVAIWALFAITARPRAA